MEDCLAWFFEGGNPACVEMMRSWTKMGRELDEIKPFLRKVLVEMYGLTDGSIEGPVLVCLGIARKPNA